MSFFFFSSRRRHTRWNCDWSSDVCSSDLQGPCNRFSFHFHSTKVSGRNFDLLPFTNCGAHVRGLASIVDRECVTATLNELLGGKIVETGYNIGYACRQVVLHAFRFLCLRILLGKDTLATLIVVVHFGFTAPGTLFSMFDNAL